ncbi:MAG: pilus assembly protein [Rhizobiaceae bacterium]|nr:pilus assembly protein [Rhizobiaceae bacterium]
MFRRFFRDKGGNVALSTAVMALPILTGAGIAVDYTLLTRAESALQSAADSAALASAKELTLSNANDASIKQISSSYVTANLRTTLNVDGVNNALNVDTTIEQSKSGITVELEYNWRPFLLHHISNNVLPIRVSATANLAGTRKICMIGLEEQKNKTIHLTKRAKLEAQECGVYANSIDKQAIRVDDDASIISGITCSAGGVKSAKQASFAPQPVTDCPTVADPLLSRQPPPVGGCDYSKFEVKSGFHTLYPGTYCDGLKVRGTAEVTLRPGIYVINGSKLEVTDNAIFKGSNVGFYLAGDKAKLLFKKKTTIDLTAPKSGPMAGMLIFEDRAASKVEKHQITSDNARVLLGTIYLPNGTLKIDSEGPIADQAAYTAIIARAIELAEGPTLYLNSDYDATDVPVPEGLVGTEVYLAK